PRRRPRRKKRGRAPAGRPAGLKKSHPAAVSNFAHEFVVAVQAAARACASFSYCHCFSLFPMRALVVDDSKTTRMIIGRILREIGFEVVEAGNGQEALDKLEELGGAEVALVDWNMPEMSGIEFVRAVR